MFVKEISRVVTVSCWPQSPVHNIARVGVRAAASGEVTFLVTCRQPQVCTGLRLVFTLLSASTRARTRTLFVTLARLSPTNN